MTFYLQYLFVGYTAAKKAMNLYRSSSTYTFTFYSVKHLLLKHKLIHTEFERQK